MFKPTLVVKLGRSRHLKVIVVSLSPMTKMMNNVSPAKMVSDIVFSTHQIQVLYLAGMWVLM